LGYHARYIKLNTCYGVTAISSRSTSPPGRNRLLALITLVLSLVVALAAAEWVLDYQRQYIEASDRMDSGMMLYDPKLGWRLSPGWTGAHHHYDFDVEYSVNRLGFRGVYTGATDGRTTAVLGDSFTFGLGVNDGQTFVQQLNDAADTFLNLAVPGYSTDQQVLQIGERIGLFKPDRVLLVVYLANDLFDNLQLYPLQADFAKPRFRLDQQGRLLLENTPVPRQPKPASARSRSLSSLVLGDAVQPQGGLGAWLGRLELFRRLGLFQPRPKLPEGLLAQRFEPALELFMALVTSTGERLSDQGAELTVALLPGQSYVERPDSVSARYQGYLQAQLMQRLQLADIPVIDLATALQLGYAEDGMPRFHPNEGHLNPAGHRTVAELLRQGLTLGPGSGPVNP